MGCFADSTAAKYGFSRADQDAFAAESVRRALAAVESGAFESEIAPVRITDRKGERVVARDETPFSVSHRQDPEPETGVRQGRHGHRGLLVVDRGWSRPLCCLPEPSSAAKAGLKPIARIVAHASHAHEPEWFTTAPVGAIQTTLKRAGWKASDVDLYEINEAFAVVTMAAMKDIGIRARPRQRPRRRLRPRPPDRRDGRPYPDDSRSRARASRQEARPRRALHRRRRGNCGCRSRLS